MRNTVTIAGLISACLALGFALTELSHLAYLPSIIALLFGLLALYLAGDFKYLKMNVKLMFMLTIIALSISNFKSIKKASSNDKAVLSGNHSQTFL